MSHTDYDVVKKYMNISQSAKTRNIEFNIGFSEFKKIFNTKKCFFTGKRIVHGVNFSIDRLDNSKGYISGNLVACDTFFNNHIKNDLSIENIELLFNGIKKHQELKKGK